MNEDLQQRAEEFVNCTSSTASPELQQAVQLVEELLQDLEDMELPDRKECIHCGKMIAVYRPDEPG